MENRLIELAKAAIQLGFQKEVEFDMEGFVEEHPELMEKRATFITLTKDGKLRGCVGSLEATRPLYEDIIVNAQLAAFKDKRFEELKEEEKIKIEISILSKPEELNYEDYNDLKEKIRPGVDGVILTYKDRSATYLPSVWEQIKSKEEFFSSLCEKAGIEKEDMNNHPEIKIYQTKKIKEIDLRKMSKAGSFYPDNEEEIKSLFDSYKRAKDILGIIPEAIIVPHAGYEYSGETACMAYDALSKVRKKRVVVIGPSHNIGFKGINGSFFEEYETPLGNIKIDLDYLNKLKEKFKILDKKEYSKEEHSTEVQMPFIKYFTKMDVIELVYGEIEVYKLEEIIDYLIDDDETCVIISTDLSHFHKEEIAKEIDNNCIQGFLEGETFQECEACGILGLRAITNISRKNGYKRELLDYRTSYEKTGDKTSVVGYMSGIIYKNRFDF